MKSTHLIATSLAVGALLAFAPIGSRGYHFFPAFIAMSGFIFGVGMLVNKASKAVGEKAKRVKDG